MIAKKSSCEGLSVKSCILIKKLCHHEDKTAPISDHQEAGIKNQSSRDRDGLPECTISSWKTEAVDVTECWCLLVFRCFDDCWVFHGEGLSRTEHSISKLDASPLASICLSTATMPNMARWRLEEEYETSKNSLVRPCSVRVSKVQISFQNPHPTAKIPQIKRPPTSLPPEKARKLHFLNFKKNSACI